MYKKLEENFSSMKTKREKTTNNSIAIRGRSPSKPDTMNTPTKYHNLQQVSLESGIQSFRMNDRITSIVGNQHSRTTINVTATRWFKSLSLFKRKTKQELQQSQHKNQRQKQQHKQQSWLLLTTIIVLLAIIENSVSPTKADKHVTDANENSNATNNNKVLPTTLQYHYRHRHRQHLNDDNLNGSSGSENGTSTLAPIVAYNESLWLNSSSPTSTSPNSTTTRSQNKFKTKHNEGEDSIFLRVAKPFIADNDLWSGIVQDCYTRPTFSCFQKNVYYYLNDVLDAQDVNVTHRLKFLKNANSYQYNIGGIAKMPSPSTQSSVAADSLENVPPEEETNVLDNEITDADNGREISDNEPLVGETPIEEVTNAVYDKSIKFAMTHDIELQMPEMMFDGATFRISPRSIEGNGVIAKLELIPKQYSEARLAGKILMKKIQKLLRSKLLLSFLALVLIIKIIKIKLFWLLPIVIGVGAAKKLLLKFLLFLFPALSHLFKLCSYYQQTFHSTKYHHHHHHINHHHTVVPAWHNAETAHIPEIIYTHPPKGHASAYLHGAPIHESYGPPSNEHFETGWANSGPGLGSEFISDINRVALVDDKTNAFEPHSNNDANELHGWGLGTTPLSHLAQHKKRVQPQQQPHQNQVQKPPINNPALQSHNYVKSQGTSHTFNPFIQPPQAQASDKQSFFRNKYHNMAVAAQSAPSPVYTSARQPALSLQQNQLKPQIQGVLSQAAQIVAQYDPTRNQLHQHAGGQTQLTPELSAQMKEAIRIQAEQRLVQQQQQILDKQPFVQDGQPLMPLNYDPFYSPILLKIDKIVEQLGVSDEFCKERLICSMYKDPQRYSPHSNFVSAELSRDINELQPVKNTNQAVVRFFRLIQAARDGQDQNDCLILYPKCNINTE